MKHRDSRHLECQLKVCLDKETYAKLGQVSSEEGISMAEVLRRAFKEKYK